MQQRCTAVLKWSKSWWMPARIHWKRRLLAKAPTISRNMLKIKKPPRWFSPFARDADSQGKVRKQQASRLTLETVTWYICWAHWEPVERVWKRKHVVGCDDSGDSARLDGLVSSVQSCPEQMAHTLHLILPIWYLLDFSWFQSLRSPSIMIAPRWPSWYPVRSTSSCHLAATAMIILPTPKIRL